MLYVAAATQTHHTAARGQTTIHSLSTTVFDLRQHARLALCLPRNACVSRQDSGCAPRSGLFPNRGGQDRNATTAHFPSPLPHTAHTFTCPHARRTVTFYAPHHTLHAPHTIPHYAFATRHTTRTRHAARHIYTRPHRTRTPRVYTAFAPLPHHHTLPCHTPLPHSHCSEQNMGGSRRSSEGQNFLLRRLLHLNTLLRVLLTSRCGTAAHAHLPHHPYLHPACRRAFPAAPMCGFAGRTGQAGGTGGRAEKQRLQASPARSLFVGMAAWENCGSCLISSGFDMTQIRRWVASGRSCGRGGWARDKPAVAAQAGRRQDMARRLLLHLPYDISNLCSDS